MDARPFTKTAGGKTQLLPELLARLPERFGTYHEPFVGGGALYWALASTKGLLGLARLSDTNNTLIRTYQAIQDNVEDVIARLGMMPNEEHFYYATRARQLLTVPKGGLVVDGALKKAEVSDVEIAAWYIYLNKTCYNGLHRVNKKGEFNVPFGHSTNTVCDADNLRACAETLRSVKTEITNVTFEAAAEYAKKGDLVYFDPPYLPLSKTSNFVSYTSDGFGLESHITLRDVALALKRRGVHVLVSNSDEPRVRELYAGPDFQIDVVQARRNVNSKGTGRGAIPELLIR